MVIVLIGAIGSGKTTVGEALAARLGWRFVDADTSHVPVHKVGNGHATTGSDGEAAGIIDSVRSIVSLAVDRRESLVVACSALMAHHRDRLAGDLRPVRFIYLKTSADVLAARLAARHDHGASVRRLPIDLATLEEPAAPALTLDGSRDVDTIVGHIRLDLGV